VPAPGGGNLPSSCPVSAPAGRLTGERLYLLDTAAALAIPAAVFVLYRKRLVSRASWYMYWAGVLTGSSWETGFYFVGPERSPDPFFVRNAEFPLPNVLLHLLHTLWDGGLFLAGVGLVRLLCKRPALERFRVRELAVMAAWGQAQELAVELAGSGGGLWEYRPRWWNPVLFSFRGHNITLAPQAVWLAASFVFYLFALGINRRLPEVDRAAR